MSWYFLLIFSAVFLWTRRIGVIGFDKDKDGKHGPKVMLAWLAIVSLSESGLIIVWSYAAIEMLRSILLP